MYLRANNAMGLPFPYGTTRAQRDGEISQQTVLPRAEPVGESTTVALPAGQPWMRWRMLGRMVVLAGVLLSTLVNSYLVFVRVPLRLPRLSFSWPAPSLLLFLVGVGGGVVLWMVFSSLFKQHQQGRPAQRQEKGSRTAPRVSGGTSVCPLEPASRQTNERRASERNASVTWWEPSSWEQALRKQTDKRERYAMRQRLRMLRLYYADEAAREGSTQRYPIKKRNGRVIFQRKMRWLKLQQPHLFHGHLPRTM